MKQSTIIVSVTIFLLILTGMFFFAHVKQQEMVRDEGSQSDEPITADPYATITRIDAKHYFIEGIHTLVGEIPMPTPCDLVEASAVVAESYPEQVLIDFTVINNAETCDQVVTPYRFQVEFTASQEARITAKLMGRPVELNLIPATEGETPDEFELFLKG